MFFEFILYCHILFLLKMNNEKKNIEIEAVGE